MPKQKPNQEAIQMELFPSEKSERAIEWRQLITEHSVIQNKLWKGVYRQMAMHLQGNLSPGEVKQIGDNLRNAGTWLKQATESLTLAEQHEQAALMANQANLDITKISDEELDAILEQYV